MNIIDHLSDYGWFLHTPYQKAINSDPAIVCVGSWVVSRVAAPYCSKRGNRYWSGDSLEKAIMTACDDLKIKYPLL